MQYAIFVFVCTGVYAKYFFSCTYTYVLGKKTKNKIVQKSTGNALSVKFIMFCGIEKGKKYFLYTVDHTIMKFDTFLNRGIVFL